MWFRLFYDRELRRKAAKLYHWLAAVFFAGLAVWVLTPWAPPVTPDTPKMSPAMSTLTTIVGSAVLFGVSTACVVSARRVDAKWRDESEDEY